MRTITSICIGMAAALAAGCGTDALADGSTGVVGTVDGGVDGGSLAADGGSASAAAAGATAQPDAGTGGATDPGATGKPDAGNGGGDPGAGGGDPGNGGQADAGGSGDPGSGGPGTTGGPNTTCHAGADCVHTCHKASSPITCVASCMSQTQGKAKVELNALIACVDGQCVQGKCAGKGESCVDDCVHERCMGPLLDCIDDGKVGAGTCGDAFICGDKECSFEEDDPYGCWATCHASMDAPNKLSFATLASCIADADDQGKSWQKVCVDPWYACVAGTDKGKGTCGDYWSCVGPCKEAGASDAECATLCLPGVSPKGQGLVAETIECGEGATPASGVCKQTYLACAEPTGKAKCAATWLCTDQCSKGKSDTSGFGCALDCMHKASTVSAAAFVDLLACTVWSPATGCMDEMLTCAAPSGTGSCAGLVTCSEGCNSGSEATKAKCLFGCIEKASKPAATTWLNAVQCWDGCADKCGNKGKACVNNCAAKSCQKHFVACSTS